MTFFTLTAALTSFLSTIFFKYGSLVKLLFRIQQLKQLLEDSTSDEDGSSSSSSECKEKHKKKKKKEKHKKRKKEKKKKKRKHKSSKSNESSDSDWQGLDLFHVLLSKIRHRGPRPEGVESGRTWRPQESRAFGVTRMNSHLPSSEDVTPGGWVVSSLVLALDSGWFQAGKRCSLSSSHWSLQFVIPSSCHCQWSETEGMSLWGSSRCYLQPSPPPGSVPRIPRDSRHGFSLLSRIIKARYLFFKCSNFLFLNNACMCSKFKRYIRFLIMTILPFLPQPLSSLPQCLMLPMYCEVIRKYLCIIEKVFSLFSIVWTFVGTNFFIFEKMFERERTGPGEGHREEETENPKQPLHCQWRAPLGPLTHESWDHDQSQKPRVRFLTDWAHQVLPFFHFLTQQYKACWASLHSKDLCS